MMQQANLPTHIGIIMDGNGRWAKKRGLPRKMGHRAGASTFKEIARYANKIGLKYLTTYVFFDRELETSPKTRWTRLLSCSVRI